MVKKKILLVAFLGILFSSCKKNYECWCTNENGTYLSGEIEGTKRQAKKQCAQVATSPTTCEIK